MHALVLFLYVYNVYRGGTKPGLFQPRNPRSIPQNARITQGAQKKGIQTGFVKKDGKLSAVKLFGGGYGHGTGMSQNGVKKMAETGRNYEEIIEHYYAGTELIFLY